MGSEFEELELNAAIFHERINDGDIVATAELAELLLPELTRRLTSKHPSIYDPHLIDMAVTDALMSYFRNPKQYQSEKMSLPRYLLMSAKGDLLNYLRPKKSDQNSVDLVEDVELLDGNSEKIIGKVVATDGTELEEDVVARLSPMSGRLIELFPDIRDQEMVRLMINGVRETREYANLLGIDHLTIKEQQDIVKKQKDRIKKMITRNIDPKELQDENG
jgi:hypothetical protein